MYVIESDELKDIGMKSPIFTSITDARHWAINHLDQSRNPQIVKLQATARGEGIITSIPWTDLPCGYAYEWDGDEGRLSDCATGIIDKAVVLSEIEAHSGLKLDYREWEWDKAFGEDDSTVALMKAEGDAR